jgi:DNA-binding transcriptional MerR regulator
MNLLPEVPSANTSIEPLYNIGVVTRMTGISMATLRAWERRYNFPEASRTLGGHRLYSERDILRLRWVKSRIEEGMQTAQAIQALRHQETSSQETSKKIQAPLVQDLPTSLDASPVSAYREQLYIAMIQRNRKRLTAC